MIHQFHKGYYVFVFAAVLVLAILTGCAEQKLTRLQHISPFFGTAKTITVTIDNYCPPQGVRHVNFFVANLSYIPSTTTLLIDYDTDGLPNIYDNSLKYDISYAFSDTNADGFSDLLIYLAGIPVDAQIPMRNKCEFKGVDSDGDSLVDCDEEYLGTDKLDFDSDDDGVPDFLELRAGMDPRNGNDTFQDPDGDGVYNIDEIAKNTSINDSNWGFGEAIAVRYSRVQYEKQGELCFDYTVDNLPIVPETVDNVIRFYFLQQSVDHPKIMKTGVLRIPETVKDETRFEIGFEQIVAH